jgi:hypothetical protein
LKYSILILIFILSIVQTKAATVELDFYSETIRLDYNLGMLNKGDIRLGYADKNGKLQIQGYYEQQRSSGAYLTLLNELRRAKQEYVLNDWLFYQLTAKAIEKIGKSKSKQHRVFMRWFILNIAGFDCRMTYSNSRTYINIYTEDELFAIPMIQEGDRMFANLSEKEYPGQSSEDLYIVSYVPNPGGRSFKFGMEKLPNFSSEKINKTIDFQADSIKYTVKIAYDATVVKLMKDYPYMADEEYFRVPISNTLKASLLPALQKIIRGKSQNEALSILASFTRNGFGYKLDEDQFGVSHPMIPEELFWYPYSDCEDRCALFYALTKELLGLDMAVLIFDDHVSMAVAAEMEGDLIRFEGKRYFVVDPTGPSNSDVIGWFPNGYAGREIEVLVP